MITILESELLPLSGLQHFVFCKRQFALIHIEQLWNENVQTAKGRILHKKTHKVGSTNDTPNKRTVRAMPLRSLRLGVTGITDVVEFYKKDKTWIPYPVEYKHGRPKSHRADEIQLCAQAISLEEMMNCHIPVGAIYYGKNKKRLIIEFDKQLRDLTIQTAIDMHKLFKQGITPHPIYGKYCESCSLEQMCCPKILGKQHNIDSWIQSKLRFG